MISRCMVGLILESGNSENRMKIGFIPGHNSSSNINGFSISSMYFFDFDARGPILSNSAKQASAVGSNSTFLEGQKLLSRHALKLWTSLNSLKIERNQEKFCSICASDQLTSPRNFDFHVIPPGLLPLPWLFLSATCSGRFQDQIVQSPWGWRAACSK